MKNLVKLLKAKHFYFFLIMMLSTSFLVAQNMISGSITDAKEEPLIGASITFPNSTKGTITDINGQFKIEASEGDILLISYIGYKSKSVTIGTETNIAIQLIEDGVGLDVITVSARRVQENLQEVPIAVSSFSLEAIKSKGLNNITEVADFAPNVEMENTAPISGSSSALVTFIRGIGQTDYSIASEAGVGLYIDGVYYARNVGGVVDLLDIDRVEVLKGPQGTLFGRNTIGGAINILTKKPSNEFSIKGDITVGGFNQFNVRTTVDIPLGEKLLSSISISDKNQDGFVIRTPYLGPQNGDLSLLANGELREVSTSDDLGNENNTTIRAKLAYYPSDKLSIIVTGDLTRVRENGAPNTLQEVFGHEDPNSLIALYNSAIAGDAPIPLEGSGPLTNPEGTPFDTRFVPEDGELINYGTAGAGTIIDGQGLTATIRYDLTKNITLKSISSYRNLSSLFGEDADFSPLIIDHHVFEMDQSQFTQELQLSGSSDKLKWVGGLYHFQEDGFLFNNVPLAGGLLQINGGEFVNTKSYAAFGQASYKITPKFGLTLGGRYTIDDKSFEGTEEELNLFYSKIGFPLEAFPDQNDLARLYPVGVFDDTFNSFDIRAGLDFKITEDVMVYASYSTGFKSGGWTTRLTAPILEVPRFDPEEAQTFELGLKSEIAEKLRFNAAAFFTDYTNLQIVVQRAVSPFLENAAEAEIKGLEFDLNYVASKAISITGGLAFLDGKYTKIDEGAAITTDNELVNAPKFSASFALDITAPFSSGAKIVLHGDYFYKSTVYNNSENTPSLVQDPINVVNLSATYTEPKKKWNWSVGIRNATNTSYLTSGFFQPGVGYTLGTNNRPRYMYTTLGFNF